MARVDIRNVRASYGVVEVLKGVSLTLEPREFVALLGPSGCGKTTLLRAVAGFVSYEGSISIDGRPYDAIPPHRRDIGLVFQDYALFPHKTVRDNIAFGLRLRRTRGDALRRRVDDLLDLLQLGGLAARFPAELSGGQRQRVAVARAIAIEPKVLLLDEPLSALDKKLREEMQVELRQLQQRVGVTTLFVTHDQEEALAMADRIVVMNAGTIRQVGTPVEIYEQPRDRFVAGFIGKSNAFAARVVGTDAKGLICSLGAAAPLRLPPRPACAGEGSEVLFSVRPERLRLAPADATGGTANRVAGTVQHVVYLGAHSLVRVVLETGGVVVSETAGPAGWKPGRPVSVEWDIADSIMVSE